MPNAERERLAEDARRERNWKRWGPYLAERQWGTVREDYSPGGECWGYLPHDHARSRAYRWGEDGLLGLTDREGRLALALALWNGRDPVLKERLFGLTGPEGNHGEDVKECYYYLDATPTHSYNRALYKYPQREFPYAALVAENGRRGKQDPEYELVDTGAFDQGRYFDVQAEYAKAGPDDVLVRLTASNRAGEPATLHLLPTLWFRNTWSWGRTGEKYGPKPSLVLDGDRVMADHWSLGSFVLAADRASTGAEPEWLFTGNDTNVARLFGVPNAHPYVKDAFHEYVVHGRRDRVNPAMTGTKAAAHYVLRLGPGETATVCLRLTSRGDASRRAPFGSEFDRTFAARVAEADAFYATRIPEAATPDERAVARQAYAGLLWSKQFYHYAVDEWLDGDPAQPSPPHTRRTGRNADWAHV